MTEATLWVVKNGLLKKFGRSDQTITPPPPGDPASRTGLGAYGTYIPLQNTHCGVIPGVTRTDFNATSVNNVTISAPNPAAGSGGIYANYNFYGDVKVTANVNITFNNCLFVGSNVDGTSQSACLDLRSARTGIVTMNDCSFIPRKESDWRDCVVGHKYEAYRCYAKGGVDGFGIFVEPAKYSPAVYSADVVIKGCMVEDLAYRYPDRATPSHTDGTHNDCIQHQGGNNVTIQGNNLKGSSHAMVGSGTNPSKPWLLSGTDKWINGACLIIQEQTTTGPVATGNLIDSNWFWGGLSHMNIKPDIQFTYTNNKHYRNTAVGTSWSGYWIRLDNHTPTVTGLTGTTNTWVDGPYAGAVLIEPRDKGIHYNA